MNHTEWCMGLKNRGGDVNYCLEHPELFNLVDWIITGFIFFFFIIPAIMNIYKCIRREYQGYRTYGVYYPDLEDRIRQIRLRRQNMGIRVDEITAEDLRLVYEDYMRHQCDVCQSFNHAGHQTCVYVRQLDLDRFELPIELPFTTQDQSEAEHIAGYLEEHFGNTEIEIIRKLRTDFTVEYSLFVDKKEFVPIKSANKT